jgi:hypothetical protein
MFKEFMRSVLLDFAEGHGEECVDVMEWLFDLSKKSKSFEVAFEYEDFHKNFDVTRKRMEEILCELLSVSVVCNCALIDEPKYEIVRIETKLLGSVCIYNKRNNVVVTLCDTLATIHNNNKDAVMELWYTARERAK